ncbi:MAG: stage II sporulation protein P [Oscillospiraceae bacterium]|nr:stage II sporulation protein P [Oscillospiraceae bacterium]
MRDKDQAKKVGALAIVLAILLRLILGAVFADGDSIFSYPRLASFLISAETGRAPEQEQTQPSESTEPSQESTEPSETTEPTEPTQPQLPVERAIFTEEDAQYVSVNYGCKLRPDLTTLLTQELNWDLTGDEPTVLILHTHGTEAFMPTQDSQYEEFGGEFRTKDERYNMLSIGDELTRLLTEAGISVIHDRTLHDLNDYNDSYDNSRVAVQEYLKKYPSIQLVLDLHRDAAEYQDGTQWATSATVDGKPSAQVMLVVGTNATGLNHPNWQTNMALAEKLQVAIHRVCPGVERAINLRGSRFNHDLSPGALIAEIGSAGNTHEEAMRAVPVLAEAIVSLVHGAN